jgi:dethiobiotin synthetase
MKNRGLFISGTDTGVGKTQVTFGLAAALARRFASAGQPGTAGGRQVRLWKPVQTGVEVGDPEADSYRLKIGSGTPQPEADIATVTLPDPLAPWMAAERAGVSIPFEALVAEGRRRIERDDYVMVEGAGGLAVPMTGEKMIADLARELELPLLLVARAGLGTVNHTVMSVYFARSMGLRVAGVVLNGYQEGSEQSLQENAMMIERFGGVPVIGKLPWFPQSSEVESTGGAERRKQLDWNEWREKWTDIVEAGVNVDLLLKQ